MRDVRSAMQEISQKRRKKPSLRQILLYWLTYNIWEDKNRARFLKRAYGFSIDFSLTGAMLCCIFYTIEMGPSSEFCYLGIPAVSWAMIKISDLRRVAWSTLILIVIILCKIFGVLEDE
jgi:hypothetical protein